MSCNIRGPHQTSISSRRKQSNPTTCILFHNTVQGNSRLGDGSKRTRGQALLELVGLVGVLQDKGVDEAGAADLELDLLVLGVALDASSCSTDKTITR